MSQQAFDCLCDIGYNAGTVDLINGNTWYAVLSGDPDKITPALMSWNKANHVVSEGLTKRCRARVNMCLYGVYDSTH
ncbi:lysozyme [Clostridium botulinum]|nr:lysozyme [Clostridium botulinum]